MTEANESGSQIFRSDPIHGKSTLSQLSGQLFNVNASVEGILILCVLKNVPNQFSIVDKLSSEVGPGLAINSKEVFEGFLERRQIEMDRLFGLILLFFDLGGQFLSLCQLLIFVRFFSVFLAPTRRRFLSSLIPVGVMTTSVQVTVG